jgi:activator of HSP90 ATPase
MSEELEMSTLLPASACRVYEAWLDSAEHSDFTGSAAEIDAQTGGNYTAWDGYIQGRTLALEPCKRILQSWRTTEFPEGAPDSLLEVLLEDAPGGTRLSLRHTAIPDGQAEQYRQGWEDYYFSPMAQYFLD